MACSIWVEELKAGDHRRDRRPRRQSAYASNRAIRRRLTASPSLARSRQPLASKFNQPRRFGSLSIMPCNMRIILTKPRVLPSYKVVCCQFGHGDRFLKWQPVQQMRGKLAVAQPTHRWQCAVITHLQQAAHFVHEACRDHLIDALVGALIKPLTIQRQAEL